MGDPERNIPQGFGSVRIAEINIFKFYNMMAHENTP
jgi:hypothetical protein